MRITIFLLPLVFGATAALAAADVRSACMADYMALCASVSPGGGRVVACMKEHREQVSTACKVAVLQHIAQRKASPGLEDNP
jgi:CelD/BcsL family acetyltransferase involved in cellulose biosynthesis